MYTGVIGTPARRAISSKPRLKPCTWPVRVMPPSGNRQTTSPALSAATTAARDVLIVSGASFSAIGIAPNARTSGPVNRASKNFRQIRNRGGRSRA